MNEYTLSVNKFLKPEIKKDKDAIYLLLIRLLLRNPGSSPSHPEMGVGIIKRYRYIHKDKLYELQNEINKQIETYLPMFQSFNVVVQSADDTDIFINVTINDTLYSFKTDFDKSKLKLSDL